MIGKLQLAAMANASPGSQFRPVHGKQNDREVTARRHGKRQTHHKGDVLILKQHAEDNGNHTEDQYGDFRYPQLFTFGRTLFEDVSVQVVRHRPSARQRQTRNHRKNGGESNR